MNYILSLFPFAFLPLLVVGISIALFRRAARGGRSRPGTGMMSPGGWGSADSSPAIQSWFSSDSGGGGSGSDSGGGCSSDSGGGCGGDGGGCGGGDGGGGCGGD